MMRWWFIDTDGVKKEFRAELQNIAGFCGGSYYWNFWLKPAPEEYKKINSWDEAPYYHNDPLKTPKALLEDLILRSGTAFCFLCDVAKYRDGGDPGVSFRLFKDIKGGEIRGDCKYTINHSPHILNWNSGNTCSVMLILRKDLADRYKSEDDDIDMMDCGCCECCGCSCDYEEDYMEEDDDIDVEDAA